jgi:hypothetical protein
MCTIEINPETSVFAYDGFEINGFATCELINITINDRYGNSVGKKDIIGGFWHVSFDSVDIETLKYDCGEEVQISITCTKEDCPPYSSTVFLFDCQSGVIRTCPTIEIISSYIDGNCQGGKVNIKIHLKFKLNDATEITYHWEIGGVEYSGNTIRSDRNTIVETNDTLTIDGDGTLVDIKLIIDTPIECKGETANISGFQLKECPACPTPDVIWGECTGANRRKVLIHFEAEAEADEILSYQISIDDGVINNTVPFPHVVNYETELTTEIHRFYIKIVSPFECASGVLNIEVPKCDWGIIPPPIRVDPPPPPNPQGEGWGCIALRWLAFWLLSIGLALTICGLLCSVIRPLLSIGIIMMAAGAVIFLIWRICWGVSFMPCCEKKPCKWDLLIPGEIFFAAGSLILSISSCCNRLTFIRISVIQIIGFILCAVGLLLLYLWKKRCNVSFCMFIKEMSLLLTVILIPIVNFLGAIPCIRGVCLSSCANTVWSIIFTLLSGYITWKLRTCVPDDSSPNINIKKNPILSSKGIKKPCNCK